VRRTIGIVLASTIACSGNAAPDNSAAAANAALPDIRPVAVAGDLQAAVGDTFLIASNAETRVCALKAPIVTCRKLVSGDAFALLSGSGAEPAVSSFERGPPRVRFHRVTGEDIRLPVELPNAGSSEAPSSGVIFADGSVLACAGAGSWRYPAHGDAELVKEVGRCIVAGTTVVYGKIAMDRTFSHHVYYAQALSSGLGAVHEVAFPSRPAEDSFVWDACSTKEVIGLALVDGTGVRIVRIDRAHGAAVESEPIGFSATKLACHGQTVVGLHVVDAVVGARCDANGCRSLRGAFEGDLGQATLLGDEVVVVGASVTKNNTVVTISPETKPRIGRYQTAPVVFHVNGLRAMPDGVLVDASNVGLFLLDAAGKPVSLSLAAVSR
jgi:hypothetical protein